MRRDTHKVEWFNNDGQWFSVIGDHATMNELFKALTKSEKCKSVLVKMIDSQRK